MTISAPNLPITEEMRIFEEEYKNILNNYANIKGGIRELDMEYTFLKAQKFQVLLDAGEKVTGAERIIGGDSELQELKKKTIELEKEEILAHGMLRLYDHKASFLTSIAGLLRSEIDKTAMKF